MTSGANGSLSDTTLTAPAAPIVATTDDKARTSFLDLPAEIRNRIYNEALVKPSPIQLRTVVPYAKEPALLLASKQVRSEVLAVFYGANTFSVFNGNSVRQHSGISITKNFLEKLGTEKAAILRSLRPVSVADVQQMWEAGGKERKDGQRKSDCELQVYKQELQEAVKEVVAVGGADGVTESAIVIPIRTGSMWHLRHPYTTEWVALHELDQFVKVRGWHCDSDGVAESVDVVKRLRAVQERAELEEAERNWFKSLRSS